MDTLFDEITPILHHHLAGAGQPCSPETPLTDLLRQAVPLTDEQREALLADLIDYLDDRYETEIEPDLSALEVVDPDDDLIEEETVIDDSMTGDEAILTDQDYSDLEELLPWLDLLGQGYLDVPPLGPDEDIERLVARQKEMMDHCFGGIGEEKKPARRAGLAAQQLQIEQQHALRLILSATDLPDLIDHLKHCLTDPDTGYGDRGDAGRTIAQALESVAAEDETSLEELIERWWLAAEPFRNQVLSGTPFSLRPRFDSTTLDTFQPTLTRLDESTWQLGRAGEGLHRDFSGSFEAVWPQVADTFVAWSERDNERWLATLKGQAFRLPDSLSQVAWADRLRKEEYTLNLDGNRVQLHITRPPAEEAWPRTLVLGEEIGLTRLSGHALYQIAWEGGRYTRHFELSSTTRDHVPIDHTELAVRLALALAGPDGPQPEPATQEEIEAAYLQRMKANEAVLGPPVDLPLPEGLTGRPVASYTVDPVRVMWFGGGSTLACAGKDEPLVVLEREAQREQIVALPVFRGRVRHKPLLTIPLTDFDPAPAGTRTLCAWAAWLAWVQP